MMQDDAAEVVTAVLTAAKAGDMVAARLILDRIMPPRRGRPVAFALPPVQTGANLSAALGAIVAAVSGGILTPEEAASVAVVVDAQRRAIETADLECRMSAIEAAQGNAR
jgi:hypothetical protein